MIRVIYRQQIFKEKAITLLSKYLKILSKKTNLNYSTQMEAKK